MITSLVHMQFMMNLAMDNLLMCDINSLRAVRPRKIQWWSFDCRNEQMTVTDRPGNVCNILIFTSKQYRTGHVPKCPQLWTGYFHAFSDLTICLTDGKWPSIIGQDRPHFRWNGASGRERHFRWNVPWFMEKLHPSLWRHNQWNNRIDKLFCPFYLYLMHLSIPFSLTLIK